MIPLNLYNMELEQAFLGAIIKNNHALAILDIRPQDFGAEPHAELYAEILRIYGDRGAVTWPDLSLWAVNRTFHQQDDGVLYVRDLFDSVVLSSESSVQNYASMIIELSRKRSAYAASLELQAAIANKSAAQCVSDFVKSLDGQDISVSVKSAYDVRCEVLENLAMPSKRDSTGLRCLDSAMAGGLYHGFTYGLCGAEKSGKTTLAHTISYNLSENGNKHLYVAMEMGARQIEEKNLAREKQFNSLVFLEDREKASSKMRDIKTREGAFYLDAPGMTVSEILHHVGLTIARHGITGFIIDYWQLVQGQQRGESEEKHLRTVAQSFADYARKNKVWCILLAQMNQDGKLFGGNGLRKACDQLYMIEQYQNNDELKAARWLRMDASRYTMRGDIGNEISPAIYINSKAGPYFDEY